MRYNFVSNGLMFFLTDVCYNNIKYAMIGHLQNPPAEFSEIIKAHYYMKKDKLIKVDTCMKLKDILGICKKINMLTSCSYSFYVQSMLITTNVVSLNPADV